MSRPKHVARNLYIELRAIFAGICGVFFASSLPTMAHFWARTELQSRTRASFPLVVAEKKKNHKIDTQNGRKKSCDKRQTTNFQPSFSAIYRLTLDETMLCWPYVRLYWTYLGPPLPVCCPRSALCEPYVGPCRPYVGLT